MYLTQLNSSHVLVSLLIPYLEGEVVGVVATLVDPESDIPARVATRDPGMPVPLSYSYGSQGSGTNTASSIESLSWSTDLRYSTPITPRDRRDAPASAFWPIFVKACWLRMKSVLSLAPESVITIVTPSFEQSAVSVHRT